MAAHRPPPKPDAGDDASSVGESADVAGLLGGPPTSPQSGSEPDASRDSWYRLLRHLGGGGMGDVVLARDRTGRRVALKVIAAKYAGNDALIRRLRIEAKTMGALRSPRRVAQVIAFFGVGEIPREGLDVVEGLDPAWIDRVHESPVLVMEHVPGATLHRHMARDLPRPCESGDDDTRGPDDSIAPFSVGRALRFGYLLALAIRELHRNRPPIEHRDLKPRNIMVTPRGRRLVILDLGLGRACWELKSAAGRRAADDDGNPSLGPPAEGFSVLYAAPEQPMGLAVGTPADVWAFGVILCQMLSGRLPFEASSTIMHAGMPMEPASLGMGDWQNRLPPSTPQSVRSLLEACLRVRPRDRCSIRDAVTTLRPYARATSTAATNFAIGSRPPVGRGALVRTVGRELAAGRARIVVLQGLPGVGKSRIALSAASLFARRRHNRPSLLCHVELDSARLPRSVDGLASEVIAALRQIPRIGARLPAGLAPGEAMHGLVGIIARRRALLILDGVDGLGRVLAQFAATLCPEAPETTLLLTAREPCRLLDAATIVVDPLRLPDPRDDRDPEALERTPATRLFLEVARSVLHPRPFPIRPERAACIARICRELGGLPWAIESVAARTDLIEIESLEERLMPLLLDERNGSDRLPASVCGLLSPPARTLLARLSIFRRGFSLRAAEAVCGDARSAPGSTTTVDGVPLAAVLAELSRVRIVRAMQHDRFGHVEPYRLHGAWELGLRGSLQPLQARFVEWFLSLVEQGLPEKLPSRIDATSLWFDAIELDLDNVRAMLELLAEDPAAAPRLAQAVRALRDLWWKRGPFPDAWTWCERALDRIAELEEPLVRCQVLEAAAVTAMRANMDEEWEHLMRAALSEAESGGLHAAVARLRGNLAVLLRKRGRFAEALEQVEAAEALGRSLHLESVVLHGRLMRDIIDKLVGRLDEAKRDLEALRPSLAAPERAGLRWDVEQNLGEIAVAQGRFASAASSFRAAWSGHGRAVPLNRFRAVLWMGIAAALGGDARGGARRLDAAEPAYRAAGGLCDAWLELWLARARDAIARSPTS